MPLGRPADHRAPSDETRPEFADVARLAKRGLRAVVEAARADRSASLRSILWEYLGDAADTLDVVDERWAAYEHVNVQSGLDAWVSEPVDGGRECELVGVISFMHNMFSLADLINAPQSKQYAEHGPRPGNLARVSLASGPDTVLACMRCGIYLVREGQRRTVILFRGAERQFGEPEATVQVVSTQPGYAAQVAAQIRASSVTHNVFRGQVVSFDNETFGRGEAVLSFHSRPQVTEDDLVLPAPTMDAINRQVFDVAEHRAALLASGQHLKRGVLLHGPPGAGKTHTVRYLTSRLSDTTVVQVTGSALRYISQACSIARALQPSMVIVEDVDLIADERGTAPGEHPLLFQLLNEMDGLADDADVLFMLTTNRADLLELALASRPGRVDQAIRIDLPDRDARRKLIELYRGHLDLDQSHLDTVLERTDGVTASFLKELLRRAALRSASGTTSDAPIHVSAAALDTALEELLDNHHAMTRILLGGPPDNHAGAPVEPQ